MSAVVDLEKEASGHEMSNQQSEKRRLPKTTPTWWLPIQQWPPRLGWLPRQAKLPVHGRWGPSRKWIHCFALHNLLVAGSRPKLVMVAVPAFFQRSGLTWAQWIAQPGRTVLGPCHSNFNSNSHVHLIGKTRVAPNTSKTGTAWWVASNQKSYIFRCTTQCKAGVPRDDFKWPLVAVPNLQVLGSLLCWRDLVSHGPNQ